MTDWENNVRLTERTRVTIFRSATSPLYHTSHSALYHVNLHKTTEDRLKHPTYCLVALATHPVAQ